MEQRHKTKHKLIGAKELLEHPPKMKQQVYTRRRHAHGKKSRLLKIAATQTQTTHRLKTVLFNQLPATAGFDLSSPNKTRTNAPATFNVASLPQAFSALYGSIPVPSNAFPSPLQVAFWSAARDPNRDESSLSARLSALSGPRARLTPGARREYLATCMGLVAGVRKATQGVTPRH